MPRAKQQDQVDVPREDVLHGGKPQPGAAHAGGARGRSGRAEAAEYSRHGASAAQAHGNGSGRRRGGGGSDEAGGLASEVAVNGAENGRARQARQKGSPATRAPAGKVAKAPGAAVGAPGPTVGAPGPAAGAPGAAAGAEGAAAGAEGTAAQAKGPSARSEGRASRAKKTKGQAGEPVVVAGGAAVPADAPAAQGAEPAAPADVPVPQPAVPETAARGARPEGPAATAAKPRRPRPAHGAKSATPRERNRAVLEEPDEGQREFRAHQQAFLLAERNNYTRQAEELKAQAEALALEHEPGDVQFDEEGGEGGTATVDRELDLHLSAQARASVEEIDAALAKIADGTYGFCESCGSAIPRARLEALPHARLCVSCKSGGLTARRQ